MGKWKIEHDRPGCIACGACAAIAPDRWEMDKGDGKSNIIGGKRTPEGQEEYDLDDKEYDENLEAAQSCPVNVIHLKDKEKDERII